MNSARWVGVVLLVAGIALAGCGSTSHGTGSPATTAAASPTETAAASPTETVAVPTRAQLKAGLLTAAEIGAPYTVQAPTQGDSGRTSGCKGVANLENESTPGEVTVSRDFSAGETGPFVSQMLAAEPISSFERSLKANIDALASCQHLSFAYEDGTKLSFELTPINFAEGATAKRLDGTEQGVELNGYLAIQRVTRNVAMVFVYFQAGSGSSQDAFHIYTLAKDKATRAFPSS
jgi:hypothetical protein